jgi:hypothetical protein
MIHATGTAHFVKDKPRLKGRLIRLGTEHETNQEQ